MTIAPKGEGKLEVELYPWSDGIKVKTSTPMLSPWRTIVVGNSPGDLPMSTLMLNLNDPNKLGDTTNKIRFIKTIHGIGYKFIASPK